MNSENNDNTKRQWHSIAMLPMFTDMINEMTETTTIQYQNFLQAEKKPHVLNDEIVSRTIKVHQTQLNDLEYFVEQFEKWQALPLEDWKRERVNKLFEKTEELKILNKKILKIADNIKDKTINKILERDDAMLGLETLLNGLIKE